MSLPRSRTPRPFLKWLGGKSEVLPEILATIPEGRFEHYIEPFLGGGAVFCELARLGRVGRAVLADRNRELIETWREVQRDASALADAYDQWDSDEGTYYRVRNMDPGSMSSRDRAARVLYLNRNTFNGLYRLNRQGRFNAPWGHHLRAPRIDRENLVAVGVALQSAELVHGDFQAVMSAAPPGALVYCDPPFWPVSETAKFTAYDGFAFEETDQVRLAAVFRTLPRLGALGLLSNADVPQTRKLYRNLRTRHIVCRRNINSDGDKRGHVGELLVSVGYEAG